MQLTLPPLIGALRPHHWIKNLAIFILPLSGGLLIGNQFSSESLSNGIFYFICLSLISSANYLINDVIDICIFILVMPIVITNTTGLDFTKDQLALAGIDSFYSLSLFNFLRSNSSQLLVI
jgi:Ni,Fe-hydrogenase I cytochrome b subunit